jgi:hypothetical protein
VISRSSGINNGRGFAGGSYATALEGFLRAAEPWQRAPAVAAVTLRSERRVAQLLQWVAAVDDDADVIGPAIQGLARIARRPDAQ